MILNRNKSLGAKNDKILWVQSEKTSWRMEMKDGEKEENKEEERKRERLLMLFTQKALQQG